MDKYRKLIIGIVGLVAMVADTFFGFSALIGLEDTIVQGIIGVLTAFGIWGFKNEPLPDPASQNAGA